MTPQPRILFLLYYFPPIKSIAVNRNWMIFKHLSLFFDKSWVFTTANNRFLPQEAVDTEGVAVQALPTFDYRTLAHWRQGTKRSDMHFAETTKSQPWVQYAIRWLNSFPLNLLFHEGGLVYTIVGVWRAYFLIKKQGITHIYSSFRPYSDHFTAFLLKKIFPHLVWIADFRDLHIDPLYNMVVGNRFQHACNRWLLQSATVVTTVSEGLATHLKAYNPRVFALRNGLIFPQKSVDTEGGDFEKFTICYTGSMFLDERNPALLLAVVRHLADQNAIDPTQFQIVYAGKDANIWSDWIKKYNLEVFFESKGLVSGHEARQLQQKSHINLLLTSALPHYGGVMTGKFFEYLAVEKPILVLINGAQDPEFERFVNTFRAGIVAYNDRSFEAVLAFVKQHYDDWQQHGQLRHRPHTEALKTLEWPSVMADFIEKTQILHEKI